KPTRLIDVDLREVRMTLSLDGTTVSEGTGAACLSHPVNAVVWLANTLAEVGTPLRAGDLVLSGALGPMVNVAGPGRFEANISGLGTVRADFTTAISS
ncbi:MAG: fumarylacetoacetate hydrolase family protein, partial [Rhodococcus sp. (in: high G+C Gram-positive bacteria)]